MQLTTLSTGGDLENWVIDETVKQHVHARPRPDLYFWRDNIRNEVDLLYEREAGGGGRSQAGDLGGRPVQGLALLQEAAGVLQAEKDYLVYGGEGARTGRTAFVLGGRGAGGLATASGLATS